MGTAATSRRNSAAASAARRCPPPRRRSRPGPRSGRAGCRGRGGRRPGCRACTGTPSPTASRRAPPPPPRRGGPGRTGRVGAARGGVGSSRSSPPSPAGCRSRKRTARARARRRPAAAIGRTRRWPLVGRAHRRLPGRCFGRRFRLKRPPPRRDATAPVSAAGLVKPRFRAFFGRIARGRRAPLRRSWARSRARSYAGRLGTVRRPRRPACRHPPLPPRPPTYQGGCGGWVGAGRTKPPPAPSDPCRPGHGKAPPLLETGLSMLLVSPPKRLDENSPNRLVL